MKIEKVDPVLVAILSNRMKAVAEEMARTLMMTSRSGIFAEARDFVTGIFDKELRLITQSDYFPGFAGALPYVLPPLVEKYEGDINEGDVFIENDPYAGNSHIPDMNVIKPVFYKGKIEFWVISKGHMADIGGRGVAGYDPEGTSIWDEGLIIPPTRLYCKGKLDEDLLEVILKNIKAKELVSGDIMCEVGGTNIGERGIIKILDRYGPEVVHSHINEFLVASEREMREKISQELPDGTYYGEKSCDPDSRNRDKPITVRVKVIVKGDEVILDFSESDPQTPCYVNSSYAFTQSMGTLTIFWILGYSKSNYGSLRPIKFINPPGTCVNCRFPASATLGTTTMAETIQEAIQLALAPAIPQLVAAGSGKMSFQIVKGFNPRTNKIYVNMDFFTRCIPSGGTEGYDGWEQGGPAQELGMGRCPDVEIQEMICPVHILRFEEEIDSSGPGKFRGGNGHVYKVEYLADAEDAILWGNGTRDWSVPLGLFGGKNPKPNVTVVEHPDGSVDEIPINSFMKIRKGDIITLNCMGGAGFGHPFERDVERVARDVRDGYVSVEKAKEEYGVVINSDTLDVDVKATAELREEHRG